MNKAHQEYFAAIQNRQIRKLSSIKVQPTMIKINGILFFTEKGKNLWKNPGHAKLALRNDLDYYFNFHKIKQLGISCEESKKFIQNIIDNAEFITIKMSDELLANVKF